ncbi:nuclear transport factor 2 family protein [Streptomyces sp. NPDC000880]
MTTTDTTDRTRATVQEFLGRIAEGAPDRIATLFAVKVDWAIADNPTVPWIRHRSTRADVAEHFRALAEGQTPDPDATAVHVIVVDGKEALLTGRLAGTVRATGKTFRSPFAMWLTIEDGLIIRYRVYEDSLAIAAACASE